MPSLQEELLKKQADIEKLLAESKQAKAAQEQRQQTAQSIGLIGDSLMSAPSFGEIWLNRDVPKTNLAGNLKSIYEPSTKDKEIEKYSDLLTKTQTLRGTLAEKESDREQKALESEKDRQLRKDLADQSIALRKELAEAKKEQQKPKPLPAGEVEKIGKMLGTAEQGMNLQKLYSPELPTGYVESKIQSGLGTFGFQKPKTSKDYATIATTRNEAINQLYGSGVSEGERKNAMEQLPTTEDAPDRFLEKSRAHAENFFSKAKSQLDAYELAGYDVSKLKDQLADKQDKYLKSVQEIDQKYNRAGAMPVANVVQTKKFSDLTPEQKEKLKEIRSRKQKAGM